MDKDIILTPSQLKRIRTACYERGYDAGRLSILKEQRGEVFSGKTIAARLYAAGHGFDGMTLKEIMSRLDVTMTAHKFGIMLRENGYVKRQKRRGKKTVWAWFNNYEGPLM